MGVRVGGQGQSGGKESGWEVRFKGWGLGLKGSDGGRVGDRGHSWG